MVFLLSLIVERILFKSGNAKFAITNAAQTVRTAKVAVGDSEWLVPGRAPTRIKKSNASNTPDCFKTNVNVMITIALIITFFIFHSIYIVFTT